MPEGKIKSKDLSYESTLPPFLQKLHAQKAGFGDADRHERPIARPKRAKEHDEEDEPTVVDESGETVTKADLKKMTASEDNEDTVATKNVEVESTDAAQTNSSKVEQKVTDGTAARKRKAVKIVGEEATEAGDSGVANGDQEPSSAKPAKKAKKKAKPIKLAFDEDEET